MGLVWDNLCYEGGGGVPSALAAAVIHPDRRVLAVCGDGGFMMNSQELGKAVRLKLNLVVLVLEDRAYGMIRWKQEVDGFPISASTSAILISSPMLSHMAPGAPAPARSRKLVTMLEAAFSEGGVHLVVVTVDYSENMRVLVNELPPVVQAK
jgi:acetolactate synthase-1/2/3 large subunit